MGAQRQQAEARASNLSLEKEKGNGSSEIGRGIEGKQAARLRFFLFMGKARAASLPFTTM